MLTFAMESMRDTGLAGLSVPPWATGRPCRPCPARGTALTEQGWRGIPVALGLVSCVRNLFDVRFRVRTSDSSTHETSTVDEMEKMMKS